MIGNNKSVLVEIWIITAGFSVLFKSSYQTLQKKLTTYYTPVHLSQIALFICILMFIPYVSYQGVNISPNQNLILNIMSGIFIGVGIWSFAKSLEISDISVVSPLQQTIPIFVVILEPLLISKYSYQLETAVASVIVIIGAMITVSEPNELKSNIFSEIDYKGPLLAILCALAYALSSIIVHHVTQTVFTSNYLLVQVTTGFIVLTILRRFKLPKITRYTAIYGFLYGMTLAFDIITLSIVNASIATIVFRVSIILNIIVGFFIFNEENIIIRSIGAALIILGVMIAII